MDNSLDTKAREQYENWILIGLCLGYKLIENKDYKTIYIFIPPTGEEKGLGAVKTIANSLYGRGFLDLDRVSKSIYKLSSRGFDKALDEIKKITNKSIAENFIG
jgi:hypothetical protein